MIRIPYWWRDCDETLPYQVHFWVEITACKTIAGEIFIRTTVADWKPGDIYSDKDLSEIYYRLVTNKAYGFQVLVTHKDYYKIGLPSAYEVRLALEKCMPLFISTLKLRRKAQKDTPSLTGVSMGSGRVK